MKYPTPVALVSALTITIAGLLQQEEQNQSKSKKQLSNPSVSQELDPSVNQELDCSVNQPANKRKEGQNENHSHQ